MFNVEIKETVNKGRGVFATRDFSVGETIEICPVIPLSKEDCDLLEKTPLADYPYAWESEDDGAFLFGYGWAYNHSFNPNAIYIRDFENNEMVYKTIREIKSGEEICVNYNGSPDNKEPIDWFKVHQ